MNALDPLFVAFAAIAASAPVVNPQPSPVFVRAVFPALHTPLNAVTWLATMIGLMSRLPVVPGVNDGVVIDVPLPAAFTAEPSRVAEPVRPLNSATTASAVALPVHENVTVPADVLDGVPIHARYVCVGPASVIVAYAGVHADATLDIVGFGVPDPRLMNTIPTSRLAVEFGVMVTVADVVLPVPVGC